jgi:hypothetical protein
LPLIWDWRQGLALSVSRFSRVGRSRAILKGQQIVSDLGWEPGHLHWGPAANTLALSSFLWDGFSLVTVLSLSV